MVSPLTHSETPLDGTNAGEGDGEAGPDGLGVGLGPSETAGTGVVVRPQPARATRATIRAIARRMAHLPGGYGSPHVGRAVSAPTLPRRARTGYLPGPGHRYRSASRSLRTSPSRSLVSRSY